jgi:hypothetical protein
MSNKKRRNSRLVIRQSLIDDRLLPLLDTDSSSPICVTVVVWRWFQYYDTLQLIVLYVMSHQLDSREMLQLTTIRIPIASRVRGI